jgi:hypothetical protein
VEEEQGLFRGTSVDWKRERDQSRETKRWWRRPHPNWLLAIQLGQAMCMGMAMAPKAEIYNSLAWYTSLLALDRARSNGSLIIFLFSCPAA